MALEILPDGTSRADTYLLVAEKDFICDVFSAFGNQEFAARADTGGPYQEQATNLPLLVVLCFCDIVSFSLWLS